MRGTIRPDVLVVGAFMMIHIASAVFSAAGPDTARDVAAALAIHDHVSYPLQGPLLAGTWHLGPLWFYLLALPISVWPSWVALALFVAALSSLQFPLAYATGKRLVDTRFGLLWCALLALPGWSSFQLVGFSHTNMVAPCTLAVSYALVRLVQERQPRWLLAAGAACGLALHAHPTTAWLALAIVPCAVYALRRPAAIAGWGTLALAVAVLPLLPLAFAPAAASAFTAPIADYLRDTVSIANLANLPALLWAMLERGPRIVISAFLIRGTAIGAPGSPWLASCAVVAVLAIELAAICGLALAAVQRPRLLLSGLIALLACAGLVAWVRPATPFYLTYALQPVIAALGALGVWALCRTGAMNTPLRARANALALLFVGAVLALNAMLAIGIARTIESGSVMLAVAPRLDVKRDDPASPLPETWLAARAVDTSGDWLCRQTPPIVLHGTYAFLEEIYLGLDHRLRCGPKEIRLIGTAPAAGGHALGLPRAAWTLLERRPPLWLGGVGVTNDVRPLWPRTGFAPSDGTVYPPMVEGAATQINQSVAVDLPRASALVVALPFATWMQRPEIRVSADGASQMPLFRDAVTALYVCARCPPDASVAWRVDISSTAPERVDVVALPLGSVPAGD